MKRSFLAIFGGLLLVSLAAAQEVPPPVQQQLEDVAGALDDVPEDDGWLQQLEYFRKRPLPINAATEDDLRSLRLLTDLQIHNLLQYRQHLGRLVDIHELQAVPGWDTTLIRRLLPFIKVDDAAPITETLKQRLKGGDHTVLLSNARVLESQKGYTESAGSHYLGSKDHLQARYQYRYKNLLQLGVTGDKDAGEPFFSGGQDKGFDFYSFHLFVRKLGVLKALALGDFTVNLGQGLTHWQSLAFGKGAEAINIKRQSAVLQPYSSAGEFYFNRGTGVTFQKGRIEATAFASYRRLSGNPISDTLSGEEFVSSLQTSGYHRTPAEVEDRNHVGLMVYGGNIALKYPQFYIGVNTIKDRLSKPLQKRGEPYNLYALKGKNWSNYSVDYSATYRNIHVYGEVALDHRSSKAFVQGLLASLDAKADVSLLYRHIEAGYQALSGRAFTENVAPTNEQGLYMGISLRPGPYYRIDAFADFYRFPWLKYRVDAPSAGRDYSLQLSVKPQKPLELYTRYRYERKAVNGTGSTLSAVLPFTRHNWRIHSVYQPAERFVIRTRAELVLYNREGEQGEKGLSTYMEGVYRQGAKLSFNLRVHYFSTDSYNSRIYAYESDLLYNYYVPAFYDQGFRYYIRLNRDVGKRISLWLRWAQTFYKNLEVIGSGLDQIKGNRRSELKMQVRWSI